MTRAQLCFAALSGLRSRHMPLPRGHPGEPGVLAGVAYARGLFQVESEVFFCTFSTLFCLTSRNLGLPAACLGGAYCVFRGHLPRVYRAATATSEIEAQEMFGAFGRC